MGNMFFIIMVGKMPYATIDGYLVDVAPSISFVQVKHDGGLSQSSLGSFGKENWRKIETNRKAVVVV